MLTSPLLADSFTKKNLEAAHLSVPARSGSIIECRHQQGKDQTNE